MTINFLYPEINQAKCVWWDVDGKFFRDQDFDLAMLKHCPPSIKINIPTFPNDITPP
jgi:hypothetical protein